MIGTINDYNFIALGQFYTESAVISGPGTVYQGIDGYREYLEEFKSVFPNFKWNLKEIIAEGDKVVYQYTVDGSHGGNLAGFPPAGEQPLKSIMAIATIEDGNIIDVTHEISNSSLVSYFHKSTRLQSTWGAD